MTGKKIEAAGLAAIEAGQGLRVWAAEPVLLEVLGSALQDRYSVTFCKNIPDVDLKEDGAVLLLARSPAEALCGLLDSGMDPVAARSQVQAETLALLAFLRRFRRRAVLLDLALLRQNPAALLGYCGLGTEVQMQDRLRDAAGEPPGTVFMVLAQAVLQADPALSRVAGEFAAATAVVAGIPPLADSPDQVLQSFDRAREKLEELELLRAQQRSMYEQLEQLYTEKKQVQDLEAEIGRLRGRLAAKTDVLNATGNMIQDLERLAHHRTQEVAALKEQLQRFRNSRSYRMTVPLRGLGRLLRRLLRGRG